jgi:uncharacterized protein YukE
LTRPTDWWVLDLDGDPTPGDPARLRQLASRFHDFAETAHKAKLAVESLQGDGAILAWIGQSGDAFREQFGEFPTQVNKLYQSHLMVGDALDTYAPVLETAQAQADRALADGRAAAEQLKSLQGALSVAQTDFTGAAQRAQQAQQETQQPNPEQVKQAVRNADAAQQRLSGAQSQVNGAQHELDLAKQLAEQAKQMRDGAARTCQRDIDEASDVGIQPRSFWEKLRDTLKQLWDIICEVAKWVALVAGVIAMIIGGPLAWVALVAGAVLLVKAIVDFTQGKGSVMDLVFGILGVIPGVKGLTTLSKLSALYKAGGVKEIAKATLTGMKNMAKDMVGMVKAAGNGAVTIVKKLSDTSGSVLGAVKSAGVTLGDAVRAGGAKLGELFPGGSPKPVRDMPVPASADRGFGMPAPNPGAAGGTAGKTFTQQFKELDALKDVTQKTELGKIKADYQAKFDAEKVTIENKYADDLKLKTDKIQADYAEKLKLGKLDIEKKYADDLKLKTDEIKTNFTEKLDAQKAEVDAKYGDLKQAKFDELQKSYGETLNAKHAELQHAHDVKIADLDKQMGDLSKQAENLKAQHAELSQQGGDVAGFVKTHQGTMDSLNASHDALSAQKAGITKQLDTEVTALSENTTKLAEGDLAAYVKQLDEFKADHLAKFEKELGAAADADLAKTTEKLDTVKAHDLGQLTNQLEGAKLNDIATATADLDKLKTVDITAADQKFIAQHNVDVQAMTAQLDTQFEAMHGTLNSQMLDAVGSDVQLAHGGSVKVLHLNSGADINDLGTVVHKNMPKLDKINPSKDPSDVNCTICVQRVDEYAKTGNANVANKILSPQQLNTIEVNYPGRTFSQVGSYHDILNTMAAKPTGTVGIIGFRGPTLSGHVLNTVNMGNGRIAFIDGQTGKLGYLPNLHNVGHPGGDELWFMPTS